MKFSWHILCLISTRSFRSIGRRHFKKSLAIFMIFLQYFLFVSLPQIGVSRASLDALATPSPFQSSFWLFIRISRHVTSRHVGLSNGGRSFFQEFRFPTSGPLKATFPVTVIFLALDTDIGSDRIGSDEINSTPHP